LYRRTEEIIMTSCVSVQRAVASSFCLGLLAIQLVGCASAGTDEAERPTLALEEDALSVQGGGGGGGGGTAAAPTFTSVAVSANPFPGGHSASGILTYSGITNGMGINLVSSNPAVLPVPSSVFIPGQAAKQWFPLTSNVVSTPTPVTITATSNDGGVRSVIVSVVPATAAQVADTVTIQKAQYKFVGGRGGTIDISARSTNPNAILTVYFDSSGYAAFTLDNKGAGAFSSSKPWNTNPHTISVRSNLGGSAVPPAF
jgi:hypothetical protein